MADSIDTHAREVAAGQRFEFGRNWARFLRVLDERRIREAERSLTDMLLLDTLAGKTFLDVGSGSGLFSLAARRLGAQVTSFDFDPQSVACTEELRRRYFPSDPRWTVSRGSILDPAYLESLGQHDVVYSWGVLHHTGDMWTALRNVQTLVRENGLLYVALYNDQGLRSRWWREVKRLYCSGVVGRAAVTGTFVPFFVARDLLSDLAHGRRLGARFSEYKQANRGMSPVVDWLDWLGGYPFEVAKPGDVFEFFRKAHFRMERMLTRPSLGNNEFVLRRVSVGDRT